jgi:hypothetical protein
VREVDDARAPVLQDQAEAEQRVHRAGPEAEEQEEQEIAHVLTSHPFTFCGSHLFVAVLLLLAAGAVGYGLPV